LNIFLKNQLIDNNFFNEIKGEMVIFVVLLKKIPV